MLSTNYLELAATQVATSAAIRPVLLSAEELLKRKLLSRVNKQSNYQLYISLLYRDGRPKAQSFGKRVCMLRAFMNEAVGERGK